MMEYTDSVTADTNDPPTFVCARCGGPWGDIAHVCTGCKACGQLPCVCSPSFTGPYFPTPGDRTAVALERIAAALEKLVRVV